MSVKGYLGPTGANLIGANRIYAADGKIIATSEGDPFEILRRDANGDVVSGPVTMGDDGTISGAIIDGSTNTINDNRFSIANVLRVKKNPGTGEFASVAAALAAVVAPTLINPWVIYVGPGIYTEPQLIIPTGVQVRGEATFACILQPTVTTTTFIMASSGASLSRLTIQGASGAGGVGIEFVGTSTERFDVDFCVLKDCTTLAYVHSTSGSTVASFRNCVLRGTFTTGISVAAGGGALVQCLVNGITFNQPLGPAATSVLRATGVCTLYVSDSIITQPGGTAINIDDGVRLFVTSVGIAFNTTGILVGNVGLPPQLNVSGLLVRANTSDLNVAHTTATGSVMGNLNIAGVTIASPTVSIFAADPAGGITFTGDVTFGPTYASKTTYTKLLTDSPTMGSLQGGALTNGGGLTVNIAAGQGYYNNGTNVVYKTWTATSLVLADASDLYVYWNSSGILTSATNLPVLSTTILLGRVVTRAGAIYLIDQSPMDAHHSVNSNTTFFRKAIGPVYESGSITTENVTPLHLNVTAGSYYLANKNFLPAAATNLTWTAFYGAGGVSSVSQNALDVLQYDVGGVLTAITAGRWVKTILYVAGDGVDQKFFTVYPTQHFPSQAAAIAAPFATPPTWFRDNVTPIAAIVIQRGTVSIAANGSILDQRPRVGFATATALTTSDHGSLTGLADDTHLQYLPVSGVRPMAGALNMGANAITAASTISATGVITTTAASNQLVLSSAANALTINGGTSVAARTYLVPDVGTTAIFTLEVSPISVTTDVTLTNRAVHLVTTNGPRSLALPAPSTGLRLVVKDASGLGAATNNITLTRPGAQTIDGIAASYVINTTRASVTIVSDGTNYFVT